MTAHTNHVETSRLSILQQRISVVTWFIVLLLSLRGLFVFYGMRDQGSVEQVITFITEPLVQLFNFGFLASLKDIPAINVLFAAISLLLVSYMLQMYLRYTEHRLSVARSYVLQRTVPVK